VSRHPRAATKALARPPPASEAELRERLGRLCGRTLGELAATLGLVPPPDLRRDKGWVGQLLEKLLGASASSRAEPDFPALGVELKSLPVDGRGRPLESTFVASLDLGAPPRWEESPVRHKLARVAWVVVQADRAVPLALRRVGAALLWTPAPEEEAALRRDYEEIVELIAAGFGAKVTGHRGAVLQLRPKGARGSSLRWGVDEDGAETRTHPRAFYLRPAFTHALLARHFQMPPGPAEQV
jgi:DNA mismatch repair protein MutH